MIEIQIPMTSWDIGHVDRASSILLFMYCHDCALLILWVYGLED